MRCPSVASDLPLGAKRRWFQGVSGAVQKEIKMQEMTMDEIEQVDGGLIMELLGIGVLLLWKHYTY